MFVLKVPLNTDQPYNLCLPVIPFRQVQNGSWLKLHTWRQRSPSYSHTNFRAEKLIRTHCIFQSETVCHRYVGSGF